MPTAERIQARTQQSFLGYRFVYRDPVFDLDKLEEDAVSAAFSAFRPWNVTLENITFKEEPQNAGEYTTNFNLLGGRFVFTIGPAGCSVGFNNPNWSEAELIIAVGKAGTEAVIKAVGAAVDKQFATITMHLTPASGTVRDITSRFVNVDTARVPEGLAKSFGFSVYGQDMSWVVDTSGAYANSLFVRIDRSFGPDIKLEQIANQLNEDETRIFEILGIEVD